MIKKVMLVGVFLFLVSFVVAEITINEPNELYSLGDRLEIRADGLLGADTGSLRINLICGNSTTNLVRIPAFSFDPEEESSYEFYKILDPIDLEIENVNEVLGACQLVTSIGTLEVTTQTFTISSDILVTGNLNQTNYDPGEPITLGISAVKANGEVVEGFVIASNGTSFDNVISGGSLSEIFITPDTIEAGEYFVHLKAYDVGQNGGILNSGETSIRYVINQIPTSIIMGLDNNEAIPGEEFSIGAEIIDQSGRKMPGSVLARLISPTEAQRELSIQADSFATIEFEDNATAGAWVAVLEFGEIQEVREFTMAAVQRVDFSIEEGVLTIKNVGNVLYNKTIIVLIGEEEMELELNIEIGEERQFSLEGPGEQEVVVTDGENEFSGTVMLTGNAIAVSDLESVGIFRNYSIVWIFLILVIGGIAIILVMRFGKTKIYVGKEKLKFGKSMKKISVGKAGSEISGKIKSGKEVVTNVLPDKVKSEVSKTLPFTNKSPSTQSLDAKNFPKGDKSMIDLTSKKAGVAESALVLKGEKYPSTVVALSIKNYSGLSDNSMVELKKIVDGTKEHKGLVDWRGEYIFILFSPLVTKTYTNEVLASKAARKILESLQLHNKKFKDKVEFNIGIHSGDLIASKEGGKLKYTSAGNTISFAKRLSESGNGKMIVSDDVRKKMMRDLKVVKAGEVGEKQIFEVSEVKNREANEAKLKELLKRM